MKLTFLRLSLYGFLADRLLPDVQACEFVRASLARSLLGIHMGRNVRLRANVDFGNAPSMITLGDGCYVNRRCTFYADQGSVIELGRNVWLGPEVMLWTGTHQLGPPEKRCGAGIAGPIVIGEGGWLGARVTVLAGVTVGAGCVVGAAALINEDMPPHSLIAGVPAKVLRSLPVDPLSEEDLPFASRILVKAGGEKPKT